MGREKKKKRKFWLDAARTTAICLVALNHAVNRSYEVYVGQMQEYLSIPVSSSYYKAFCLVLSHLGVPLFLMISGALLLGRSYNDGETVISFYRHNLLDIFITSEIWYFIMYWGIVLFFDKSFIGNVPGCIIGCIKTMLFIDQKTMGSMWYIPVILCLYFMIPLMAISIEKFGLGIMALPCIIVYASSCVIPLIDEILIMIRGKGLEFAIQSSNVFSFYLLYVIAGYTISKEYFGHIKTRYLILLGLLFYILSCLAQIAAFKAEKDMVFSYEFPLFLPIAIALFELFRRMNGKERVLNKKWKKVFTYMSKIAFAIYFIHVCIMTFIEKFVGFEGWYRPLKCTFLFMTSMMLSVAVIWVLSHIPFLRRYLLFIKDKPS